MSLCEKIKNNKFVLTSEIGPPKGISMDAAYATARLLSSRVDALNVTDLQSSVLRLGSLAVSAMLKKEGYEPIFQLTCRDRNRLALQSDLLSAAAFGIKNCLILTGDHPTLGDHPQAKAVYDLDAVQLLQAARMLTNGYDMNGHKLVGALPDLCLGAVVNPGADPIEPQIIRMEQKIEAGAQFFQTQSVFDVGLFEKFLARSKHLKTTIIAGIVVLKSASMARFMNKNIPGVCVPDALINEMEESKDKQATSVEIAVRLIRQLKPLCQGIHIMPIGWDHMVVRILDAAGL